MRHPRIHHVDVFHFPDLLAKKSSYWASSTLGLSEQAVGSSAVRESRSFPTGLEGIIKEGELFLVAWSPGATVRASEAARRHWSEQNKEPGVSLPQDAHFSNKVDIWDGDGNKMNYEGLVSQSLCSLGRDDFGRLLPESTAYGFEQLGVARIDKSKDTLTWQSKQQPALEYFVPVASISEEIAASSRRSGSDRVNIFLT
ncbi:hypothetical protein ASPCAL06927 [Aspergillus calidoustus]|uniref:Uncharacterized protein n=1 Tax=Aspergillus calidoustus TaxID=454130 RepID=A0A0U4Z7W5_ASPCI|nr:hypothetical protein ASPCAL06927 [Aspergillus calidoustus]